MAAIPVGQYRLTAFKGDFSDGNLSTVAVKFSGQTVKADLTFRGGNGGGVTGTVVDASNTPIKARVAISGEDIDAHRRTPSCFCFSAVGPPNVRGDNGAQRVIESSIKVATKLLNR